MGILIKENLVGAEAAPTAISSTVKVSHSLSKENQLYLLKLIFSHTGSDGKLADVVVGHLIGMRQTSKETPIASIDGT